MVGIHIIECTGLAAADSNGASDPYVKAYLYYHNPALFRDVAIDSSNTSDRIPGTKRKTQIIKKTLNPCFNETLKYDFDSLVCPVPLSLSVQTCVIEQSLLAAK